MRAVYHRDFCMVVRVDCIKEFFEGLHKAIQLPGVAGWGHADEILNFNADRWEVPKRLQTCVKKAVQLAILVLDSEFFA
jgi:hypothetical protein